MVNCAGPAPIPGPGPQQRKPLQVTYLWNKAEPALESRPVAAQRIGSQYYTVLSTSHACEASVRCHSPKTESSAT